MIGLNDTIEDKAIIIFETYTRDMQDLMIWYGRFQIFLFFASSLGLTLHYGAWFFLLLMFFSLGAAGMTYLHLAHYRDLELKVKTLRKFL